MSNIETWSTTAGSNNSAAPDGWPENMNYSDVNNSARENMAAAAKLYADMNGTLDSTGSSSAYALATSRVVTSYSEGLSFVFEANHTCAGASTLDVDGVGATAIRRSDGTAMASGDIIAGEFYQVMYDGTYWVIFPRYSVDLVTLARTQTLTNKTLTSPTVTDITITGKIDEQTATISGTSFAATPSGGTQRYWTLTANSSITDSMNEGESLTVWIDDGASAYNITSWPTADWLGGTPPANLPTSGYARFFFEKVNSTLFITYVGDYS